MKKWTWGLTAIIIFASSGMVSTASAVAITDGSYMITINPSVKYLGIDNIVDIGTDGDWNTSFSYSYPSYSSSLGMWDSDGNGNSGEIGIAVTGGAISFTSYQVDCIGDSIEGFCQGMTDFAGSNGATSSSETTLNLATRFYNSYGIVDGGIVDGSFPANFTTGTASLIGLFNMSGTPVANAGDLNTDGIDDYTATFVSIGYLGADWGDFQGVPYAEVWDTQILSSVPVPAAVWLFGSGLVGLAGMACRRKA